MKSTTKENVVLANPINYYVYFVEHERLQKVSKNTFRKSTGKVWKPRRNDLVRIHYQSELSTRYNVKQLTQAIQKWIPESFLKDMWVLAEMLPKLLQIAKIGNELMTPTSLARVGSIMVRIIKVISSSEIDLGLLTSLILDMYSMTSFVAQSLDSMVLGIAIEFLPSCVKNLLRSVSMISRIKLMEEYPLWQWLTDLIRNCFDFLAKVLPIPQKMKDLLSKVVSYLPIGTHYLLIGEITKAMDDYAKQKQLIGNQAFQEQVLALNEKVATSEELQDMRKHSVSVDQKLNRFRQLIVNVNSYRNTSRVEPAMFVFDGPPGTLKSVVMTKVLSNLGLTVYSHLIKASQDGKDFYDAYDNQDVFYMDDVGQQGRSQWRTFINMISSVRMPLECANVALKDTKFFSSDTVLLTTNNFMNLHGFTEQDCISSPEALFRRGLVFDFTKVIREGGLLKGEVSFKVFNQKSQAFERMAPAGMHWPSKLPFCIAVEATSESLLRLVAWIKVVILAVRSWKKENYVSLNTTDEEKELITLHEKEFLGEGLTISALQQSPNNGFTALETISVTNNNYALDFSIVDALAITQEVDENETIRTLFRKGDWDKYLRTTWYETIFAHLKEIASVVWEQILNFKKNASFWVKKDPELTATIAVYGVIAIVMFLVEGWAKRYKEAQIKDNFVSEELQDTLDFVRANKDTVSSQVEKIQRHMYQVTVDSNEGVTVWGLCTGRYVILPCHAIGTNTTPVITVWKDRSLRHAIIDHFTTSVSLRKPEEDMACLYLGPAFPTPFKKCAISESAATVTHLTTGVGSIPIDRIKVEDTYGTITYDLKDTKGQSSYKNSIAKYQRIVYGIHAKGLCGSLVTDLDKGACGMHVAGNYSTNAGVSILWSLATRKSLNKLIAQEVETEFEIHAKDFKEFSGMRLKNKVTANVASKSSIRPSPLAGIYPIDRIPADLQLYGRCTVKDIAKKSMKLVKDFGEDELKFGEQVLRSMTKEFSPLTESEIVNGDFELSGLNKKSSNGYKMDPSKDTYIDFPAGKFTDRCKEELAALEASIVAGSPDWEKLYWVEALKDEIRNEEKAGVPRSFRVGTILHQILSKKIFGNWTRQIMAERDFNKIMIGSNPIKEWPKMYSALKTGKVFAGDISNWDGNMAPQVQQLITRVITEYIVGEKEKKIGECLLQMMHTSLVVVQDDLYLTTHSMPSGSFLTAILNSVVNKLYTAIWYYRQVPGASVSGFWQDVDDFVYGDDKVNVIRKHEDLLNAVTMKTFFESVGMGFTDSVKKPISTPFQEISEITFLKRSFIYHNLLHQIVPALELRTLRNSLSWADTKSDVETVVRDKINNFQREIYLHPNREELLADFLTRLKAYNIEPPILTSTYLQYLYKQEPEQYLLKYY
jgi:hypothetical protein